MVKALTVTIETLMDGEIGNDDLTAIRETALDADKYYSKSRLRDEFKLKPKSDAVPVKVVKNGYGGKSPLYRVADCIPIREVTQKEPTSKQLRARAIQALKSKLRGHKARAGAKALSWLDADCLFLDSETTGLGYDAQIVELAIADRFGNVLFETKLKPTVQIEPDAINVHGYNEEALSGAPSWPDVINEFKNLVDGRMVVIFNEEFDSRMILQTCEAFALSSDWWNDIDTRCAMYLSADAFGATNSYGSISLINATYEAGVTWTGAAHSATGDVLATVELINAIANIHRELHRQLADLECAIN